MKRLWHLAWLAPLALVGFLWLRAGMDARYLVRVLVHRQSSTGDYRWKASATLSPSPTPSPWPENLDCAPVTAAFAREPGVTDMASDLTAGGALSLLVVRRGAILCEWNGNGGGRDAPAAAFSVSKTVTSLLLARGFPDVKLDDPITRWLPELLTRDPRFGAITLAALVDMRSGIGYEEETPFPWVDKDGPLVYYASDLARNVVERTRIVAPPGTFLYNDYAPNLNGLALQRASGGHLLDRMQALWSDLGAEHAATWSVDDNGFPWFESGLVVTARDLARVGELLLNDGKVGDRQVAPRAFVGRSLDPTGREQVVAFDRTPVGYWNGWWRLGDDLVAMGRYGQVMLVSPSSFTVIVRLGLDGHDETNIAIARRLARVAAAVK